MESLYPLPLYQKAETLLDICKQKKWRVATAESCTGGLISGLLTEVPGSSMVIGRSFVTYSNRAKHEILGVEAECLTKYGAVSEEVVSKMAENTLAMTSAKLTIAVSGIAGPGGGSAEKPVGTVHMASATEDETIHICHQFGEIGRAQTRMASVDAALDMLLARVT